MKNDSDELRYLVGLSHVPGIGRVRLAKLRGHFGSARRAWQASADEIRAAGLDPRAADSLAAVRDQLCLDSVIDRLEQLGIQAMSPGNPRFPSRLREVYDAPFLIYVKGSLLPEDELALGVVGTRRPSVYGKQAAEELARDLALHGLTIVSGLAAGIDAVAHRAAIEAGGRTIAVTGCGLDMVYPAQHTSLARQIAENGALVSEFPPGTKPRPEHFPQRNRIISGLSLGVLVVEAGQRSGALLTADRALDQNRDVFAVPGSIYSPASIGTNLLIQQGAKLVRKCSDILEELKLDLAPRQLEMKECGIPNDTESRVLRHLTREAMHVDTICRISGLPAPTVASTLTMLEIKGLARQTSGMNYILN